MRRGAAGAIVLILLLVFILGNTQSVRIAYFGASGHLPRGVALLLAAIGEALVTGIVGAARIMRLRCHVRRRPHHAATAPRPAPPAALDLAWVTTTHSTPNLDRVLPGDPYWCPNPRSPPSGDAECGLVTTDDP